MIIPSFFNSLHDPEVYPQPERFLPERWLDAGGSANINPKNYLVFGSGPHRCIGLEYASMNISLVLATASVMMDWEHDITPQSYLSEWVFIWWYSQSRYRNIWSQDYRDCIPQGWMPTELQISYVWWTDRGRTSAFNILRACRNHYNHFIFQILFYATNHESHVG